MAYGGGYRIGNRYRERAARKVINTILLMAGFSFCLLVGFWMGRQHSVILIDTLKKEAQEAQKQEKQIQDELTKVRAEAKTSSSRLEQLQAQYLKDLPEEGPMRELVAMIHKQIDDGMPAERLSFLIRSARPPRNCSDPATKRFMVRTPAYTGPDSSVAVADGAVNISGSGTSARSKAGQIEAWYDSTQPITVLFKVTGGETEKKTGTLPFQHSLIVGGKEYRFTVSEGEKSFAKVTFDSCDYP